MAKYTKYEGTSGNWAKGAELYDKGVKRAKIMSETEPKPSKFQNEDGSVKMQDVCKIQFEGISEQLNLSLNRANLNALVDAFGEDSKNWIGKYLTVNILEGSKGFSIYLIPDGFKRIRDENNYVVIIRDESAPAPTTDDIPVVKDDAPF